MEDKMFVECKAGPGAKVTLYYQVEREHVISEEKTEPLKERYQGIYNKDLSCFTEKSFCYRFVIEAKRTDMGNSTADFTGRGYGSIRTQ